jgi:Peptidase family M23
MAKMSVKGIVFTSEFGPREHTLDKALFHWGADYGPPVRGQTGVPLFAIFAGPVKRMKDGNGALGVRVGSRATEAVEFWHLASFADHLGKTADEGDLVGEMGTTGLSTGIHVHVERWVEGKRINPVPFIDKQAKKSVARGLGDNDTEAEKGFLMALTHGQQVEALELLRVIRNDQTFADGKFSRAQRTQDLVQETRDALLKPVDGFATIDVLRTHAIATLLALREQAKAQGITLDEDALVAGVLEGLGRALMDRSDGSGGS